MRDAQATARRGAFTNRDSTCPFGRGEAQSLFEAVIRADTSDGNIRCDQVEPRGGHRYAVAVGQFGNGAPRLVVRDNLCGSRGCRVGDFLTAGEEWVAVTSPAAVMGPAPAPNLRLCFAFVDRAG